MHSWRQFTSIAKNPQSGAMQSVITVGGSIVAMSLSAVAMLLLSRVLGPVQFGVFSVGFALLLILNKMSDLGLTLAQHKFIPRATSHAERNDIFGFAVLTKFRLALVLAVVGSLFVPTICKVLHFSAPSILYVTFWANLGVVGYEQLLAMLQGLHRFSQAVTANIVQATTKIIFAMVTVPFFSTNVTIAYGLYAAAPTVVLFLSKYLLPDWVHIDWSVTSTKHLSAIKTMAYHSGIWFLSLGIIDNVDVLFVQRYLNEYDTGLLGGASKIAMLVSLSAYTLSTVLNARAATYLTTSDRTAFIKKGMLLSLASVIVFLILTPLAPALIALTIGDAYAASAAVLQVLLAAAFLAVITTPITALFFSFKKAEWYFSVGGILQVVLLVIGNIVFVPRYGLLAAAWVRVATKALFFVFSALIGAYYFRQHAIESTQ